jgi:acetyl esterase
MAIDEPTAALLTQLAASGLPPLHQMTPEQARSLGPVLQQMSGPGPEVAQIRDDRIPVGGGATIAARIAIPPGEPCGVIAYLHGGGWVLGFTLLNLPAASLALDYVAEQLAPHLAPA